MKNLKKEYDKIKETRMEIINNLNELKEDKKVKLYLELSKKMSP